MNVWNKVLMALIAIICVVFGIFASNKYQFVKENERKLEQAEKDLGNALAQLAELKLEVYGGSLEKNDGDWLNYGLDEQLKYVRNLQRGDSYVNCQPVEAKVSADEEGKGSSTLSFLVDQQYQTSAFRTGSMVYVFDSGKLFVEDKTADAESGAAEESAAAEPEEVASDESADAETAEQSVAAAKPFVFLGAYRVTGVNDRQVNLASTGIATKEELERITTSKRSGDSWVAYVDALPIDSPKDVANFVQEYDEVASGFSDEHRAFFAKSFEPPRVEKPTTDASDAAEEGGEGTGEESATAAIVPVELPVLTAESETRYPVDFQGRLERLWCSRDAAFVTRAQAQAALNVLTSLIADQFVMIGGEVDASKVESIEDWDDAYAAAKSRKKSPSLTETLDARSKELAVMEKGRDLVKRLLDDSNKSIAELKKAISASISQNAKLAAQIASAQFKALEKIERESAKATAADDSNFSLNDARL